MMFMTMQKIYENKQFIILGDDGKKKRPAYILINKRKGFDNGHTHIDNFNTAKWIMNLYMNRKLPHDLGSVYLLQSLVRISDDVEYTRKVTELLEAKINKKKREYVNVPKHKCRRK